MTPKAGSSPPPHPRTTLAELARHVGGAAEGDGALELTGAAGLGEAGPGDVTFVDGPRRAAEAAASAAGAVIAPPGVALPGRSVVRAADPRRAFALALELFHPVRRPPPGIHPAAVVEPGAAVDPTATVSAFCYVGAGAAIGPRSVLHPFAFVGAGATLGADVVVHPMVTLREGVRLGDRVIVHAGAVLGSDGFSYVFDGAAHRKVPQVGTVEVGDDVEIGAGTTIDRATTGVTRIGRGTKIDNLVQVGHNVRIGEHAILVAQVGIGGSSTVGDGTVLAGQVGVADHIAIGPRAVVGAQAGVMGKVAAGEVVAGFGPQPRGAFLRSQAIYEHLPEMRRRLIDLEKRLAAAERALDIANETRR
jgi:UDP-3-O-[3-hydroxymyristoyl] glucosamine N-acyltransferase